MGDGWKWVLGIAGVIGLIVVCNLLANDETFTRTTVARETTPTATLKEGLGVSRVEMQRSYEALGLEFDAPKTLADGRISVKGTVENAAGPDALVELIGSADDLTEIAVVTAPTDRHARRYLQPVLLEVLEFAPDHVEKSSSNMLIGAARGKAIALQGVSRPVVGELSVTPELGLLFLTVKAAN